MRNVYLESSSVQRKKWSEKCRQHGGGDRLLPNLELETSSTLVTAFRWWCDPSKCFSSEQESVLDDSPTVTYMIKKLVETN
jgi:hypothetical protein